MNDDNDLSKLKWYEDDLKMLRQCYINLSIVAIPLTDDPDKIVASLELLISHVKHYVRDAEKVLKEYKKRRSSYGRKDKGILPK